MIAITRYRVPPGEVESFTARARTVLEALAGAPGHVSGRLGRAADDPDLWALITEWTGAGFYRRALGAYEVRVTLIPLSALALDEPGAYEIVPLR
ncbi:MAG TPA: antibiotic biosynthesis monooxygenase [Streptosporangiaceae bacterium]|nr:antibiotic biosynthesis monooxygenase [Streptosporangiaceae bacterium]